MSTSRVSRASISPGSPDGTNCGSMAAPTTSMRSRGKPSTTLAVSAENVEFDSRRSKVRTRPARRRACTRAESSTR
ncbi:unannotated protein [freshwater metagenome]|uniref:Unannotated protein n=1 Tax=freshwater metagenome TaxID=449393 RepID=A0A6J6FLN7_9ZZZZ